MTILVFAAFSTASGKDAADPARFEKDIVAFETADREMKSKGGVTVFVGASNIRRWGSLGTRFKALKPLNRGFGGACMSDVAHFANRIVLPLKPKQIYVNAGGNDLHGGRSPSRVVTDFAEFVEQVKTALPKTKISLLAIPPSPARWDEVELMKQTNDLLADFCAKDGQIDFIDTFSLLLGSDGLPRPECYAEDRLHFTEAGYDIITSAIRWQGAINALVKKDSINPPPANPIVFVGSSSVVKWKSLSTDFPNLRVVNHGFGGSELFDSVTYAHRIVLPCKPRQIVLYAGGNDINGGKSADRVFADYKAFVSLVLAALPETKISYISVAGNPKRWSQIESIKALNTMIAGHVKTDKRLDFIDVYSRMLGADGLPIPGIFVSDQLHMNENGYAIWKEVVKPFLVN